MASALPGIFGTTIQAQYPITRIVSFETRVNTFMTGAEQRWPNRGQLTNFVMPFKSLGISDRTNYLTFLSTVMGMQGQDLSVTLGANTWGNLTLLSDSFAFTQEHVSRQYNLSFNMRQVQNSGWSPASAPTAYPTFSTGAVAMTPMTDSTGFLTNVVEGYAGTRYGFGYYGTSLTNFPTGPLKAWKITYPVLPDADVSTLETFFVGCMGKYISFTFTDPSDSTTYDNVRFDQDELHITYAEPNHTQIEVSLIQTNGS
jgi:hypothetical protein